MKIEDNTIVFKSGKSFFEKERSGKKPNTIRIVEYDEYKKIIKLYGADGLTKIRIELVEKPSECFERELTDISLVGIFCGKVCFVFSWRHEE